jgi:hypothetical protein
MAGLPYFVASGRLFALQTLRTSLKFIDFSSDTARVKLMRKASNAGQPIHAEELKQAVWLATLGVPLEGIARQLPRHSADSIHLALLGVAGAPGIHSSEIERQLGEELVQEPRFAGWRDDLARRSC